jgi:predicted DNA-binding ribbon-helix-helix protein
MDTLAIQIPHIEGEQDIEVDVRINGIKKTYNYRIEIFFWDECETPKDNRAACIREMVGKYDSAWELIHIGSPTEEYIPITFRKRK